MFRFCDIQFTYNCIPYILGNNGKEILITISSNETEEKSDNKYCTIVMGSCTDQRSKTMATYQALHREWSDLVLLLGDNVYADLAPPTCTKYWAKCCCKS